jgi:hypothetical protein
VDLQGGLFIVVLLFLPLGVASLGPKLRALVSRRSTDGDGPAPREAVA